MLDIGDRKQLFIDERFFAECEGIALQMGTPVQHLEPVLLPDRAWEEWGIGAYNTVWREADGRWRMWYDATMKTGLPMEGARRLGYAESADGLHWEKPALGLVEFRGSRDNNIVAPLVEQQSMQGATVLRDERAAAEERYKLWTKFQPTDEERAQGVEPGLWAMHSADGLHWQYYPDQPNPLRTMCDTQNMFFWDDWLELYVGYTRVRETQHLSEAAEGKGSYRCVGRMTSPDFRHWSAQEIVFEADEEDLQIPVPFQRDDPRPNIDFYTSCATKYDAAQDAYFMLPAAYYHWGEDDFPATMDVQLLSSRDGISWQRQGERRAFLRQGWDGGLLSGMLFANPWFIPVGDELWLYYNGTARRHGSREDQQQARASGIFRASLRLDGFVAAEAGYGGGAFTTPLLQFAGERLVLNFDGGAGGWLRVEVLDENGQVVQASEAVMGNGVCKEVSWEEPIGKLAGTPVRLRFEMRDARLYALQFLR